MVKNDTSKVVSHLIHKDSVIVWHDYARNPETIRYEILYGILSGCPSYFHKHLFHIANTLCAVYLPEMDKGKKLEAPVKPEGAFSVEIDYRKSR
jgi:hypothetical protein